MMSQVQYDFKFNFLGKYYWLSGGWMVINKSNKIKIMVSIIITTVSSGSNTFVYDLNGVK